jgi:hypothetical protein
MPHHKIVKTPTKKPSKYLIQVPNKTQKKFDLLFLPAHFRTNLNTLSKSVAETKFEKGFPNSNKKVLPRDDQT